MARLMRCAEMHWKKCKGNNMKTQFESFLTKYLEQGNCEKAENFIVSINGVVVTEVIENHAQLDEAIEGALAINPDSEIVVYQQVAYETVETEEEVVEAEDEVLEITAPDVETPTETVEEADEAPKDSPRSESKSERKARKAAKKAAKKAKKSKKSVGATQAVARLHKDTGAVLKEYDSISHASDDIGVHSTNISKVCRGIRGSAGGFGWKYL